MTFAQFAEFLQKLEGVSSRLEITRVLAELFQQLESKEVTVACYMLLGQLSPPYASIEFQVAVKTVMRALARVEDKKGDSANLFGDADFSKVEAEIEKQYKKIGDLGLLAAQVTQHNASSRVSVSEVYDELLAIAKDTGEQSQQRKLLSLVKLLQKVDTTSAKFVVRIILGRLRLGFSNMTIMDGLSWAMTGDKSEHDSIEEAYQKKADIGKIASVYLSEKSATARAKALDQMDVEPGVPIVPQLCQRLNSAAEIIDKMHDVIAEPKYDGLRVQIHVWHDGQKLTYRTFTRNLEETSHMFPELEKALPTLNCKSCILDAEAVGYKDGELLDFQTTMQRKRKHDVSEKAKEVPVRFHVFDLLFLDGKDVLRTPLSDRKKLLYTVFEDNEVLVHTPELRTTDAATLREYHEKMLSEGLEGVVIKQIDSPYQSGRKGWSWVKIKEAEGNKGKLSDTLDVIVMGYYSGRGKRAQFGIGAVLVGVLDGEKVLTIAKIGTGLTEDVLKQTKHRCDALAVKTQPKQYEVSKLLIPDVWCQPEFVIEVAADELTKSPQHSAGVALRFPRLVKFREDKKWTDATTKKELANITL